MNRLIDIKSEKKFIRRFVEHWLAFPFLFKKLHVYPSQELQVALHIPSKMLIDDWDRKPGDVDFIFKHSIDGRINLTGVEAKFINFHEINPLEAKNLPLHETGLSQAIGLKEMGFNYSWIVYFVTKSPVEGREFEDWIKAGYFGNTDKRIRGKKYHEEGLEDAARKNGIGILIVNWGEIEPKMARGSGSLTSRLSTLEPVFSSSNLSNNLSRRFDEIAEEAFKNTTKISSDQFLLILACEHCKKSFAVDIQGIPDRCTLCQKYLW